MQYIIARERRMGPFDEHPEFMHAMSGLFDIPGNHEAHAEMLKKIQKKMLSVSTKDPGHIFADANVKGLETGLEARRKAEVDYLQNSIQEFFRQDKAQKEQIKKAKKRNKKLSAVNTKLTDEMSAGRGVLHNLTREKNQLKDEMEGLTQEKERLRNKVNRLLDDSEQQAKETAELLRIKDEFITELCAQVQLIDMGSTKPLLQEEIKKMQEFVGQFQVGQTSAVDNSDEESSEHSVQC